jgi:deoxycytidine triphosphate deaminase
MVRRGFIIQGGVVDVRYHGHLIIPILNGTNHKLTLVPGERAYQLLFYTTANELSASEAAQHGAATAKYAGATPYSLEARTDSEEELAFIKRGDVDGLKQRYNLRTE